jgi:hypothetical protein
MMLSDRAMRMAWIVTIAAILYMGVHLAAAAVAHGAGGVTNPIGPLVPIKPPPPKKACGKISAERFNVIQRKRRALGERVRFARKPVCVSKFREVKEKLRKARADCKRQVRLTTASHYPLSGRGSCGPLRSDGFATLASGDIDLPCGAVIYAKRGRTVQRLVKVDNGDGGGGLEGTTRGLDLVQPAADAFGFNGLAVVEWSTTNCWAGQ